MSKITGFKVARQGGADSEKDPRTVRQERLARSRNILGIEQHTSAEHKSMGYMWLELGQDQIQGQVRHRRLAVARAPLISKGYPAAGQPDIRSSTRRRDSWLEDSEVGTSSLDRNILRIEQ